MHGFAQKQEVTKFVRAALECTIFLSPRDAGLTAEELFDVGGRAGFEKGEIADALPGVSEPGFFGDKKIKLAKNSAPSDFHVLEDPDFRSVPAFDFVVAELRALARKQGAQAARIGRDVLVARAVYSKLPELAVEAAITLLLDGDHLSIDKAGMLGFPPGRDVYPSASEQVAQVPAFRAGHVVQHPERTLTYSLVKDVIERRGDGRMNKAEPLDAFADALERLGYAPFRLWWKQTVAELKHAEPTISPVATAIFAAGLVEGALTFVVKHARGLGLGVFGSKDFERDPRSWKVDDLVSSACAGQDAAILDAASRHRADELIKFRQRIHAGRMLSEFPGGVPDLRPEEARAARESAEIIVRRVLDWLEKHPAVPTSNS